jgi:flagellar L-ring protein precursor FlgH
MNPLIFLTLIFLSSCADFVGNVHRQIDREEKKASKQQRAPQDRFASYRTQEAKNPFKRRENDKRPIKDPMTYSLGSGPSGQVRPPVKRQYRPQRYDAEDFKDGDSDGSLWANQGASSSLFTYQNDKRTGDMVIINVLENLRNQISSELKRVFPEKPKKTGEKDPKEKGKSDGDKSPATAGGPQSNSEEMDMKVYDKISGVVMEEISKDYILLRGRKEVIFKKEKRSIEVQALVSRKDIMENDYVNSDKLLESRIFVVGDYE